MSCEVTEQPDAALACVKELVRLEWEKESLKESLKVVEAKIAIESERVLNHFQQTGTQNINMDGRTVYVRRDIYASARNVEALRNYVGTADLVKPHINGNTLSAWVRELDKDDQNMPILPDELKDAVTVTERYGVQTRKG